MYKFVLTWWKNSIKQCFCHQELPCCLISTSSPALNNKTSFAQVMMVQVGTVTTLLVLFGGTVNDYILFMVEHWSCFAKNWGGEGEQKMSSKKVRERVQGQKSPQIPFLYTRVIWPFPNVVFLKTTKWFYHSHFTSYQANKTFIFINLKILKENKVVLFSGLGLKWLRYSYFVDLTIITP